MKLRLRFRLPLDPSGCIVLGRVWRGLFDGAFGGGGDGVDRIGYRAGGRIFGGLSDEVFADLKEAGEEGFAGVGDSVGDLRDVLIVRDRNLDKGDLGVDVLDLFRRGHG